MSSRHARGGAALLAAGLTLTLAVVPFAAHAQDSNGAAPTITVLSGRPDTITGGDALVRVDVPDGLPGDLTLLAGGKDQTDAFTVDSDTGSLLGRVTDLPPGDSTIEVRSPDGSGADLAVTNFPQEGPVFSGPHEEPFLCETEQSVLPVIGDSLGAPLDEDCSIADRVDYYYQTTKGVNTPWPDGQTESGQYPADLKTVRLPDGTQAPFIVRMETFTVNRAIAQTTILHDPIAEPEPSPTARPSSWSGGVVFMFNGGPPGGWYRQGTRTGDITNTYMLSRGYALMASSLNAWSQNANDLLSAETAMMVREEFVERDGVPDFVIGFGSSGGSYQALQVADNYPGILDGLLIQDTFPDAASAVVPYVTDAKLLTAYLDGDDTAVAWTDEQKRAVTGFTFYGTARGVAGDNRINPFANCDMVPAEQRYHPVTNPLGARCDLYSHTRNAYGTDPATGRPYRPLDNVGVQYGLGALEDGVISVDQFLDLNEKVGGFDADAQLVPGRTVADLPGLRALYQTGRLLNGGGGLADIPVIDRRSYLDANGGGGDIHIRYHSLSLRQRLIDANGTADNLVSVMRDSTHPQFSDMTIPPMEQWLRDIAADDSGAARIDKIRAHRPAGLRDGCYRRDGSKQFLAEPLDRDPMSVCEQEYPSGSFPREVAGDSIAAAVAKCQVVAPTREDYADVEFTDEQWARLQSVFPDGVCDYSAPGVEQQGLAGTWIRFDADGWTVMPDPPTSVPIAADPDPELPPAWDATATYTAGDQVTHQDSTWKALWWTQNETPGSTPWGAWQEIANTPDGTAIWTPSRVFTTGDLVDHDGTRYIAQWWTRNQEPTGAPWSTWTRQ